MSEIIDVGPLFFKMERAEAKVYNEATMLIQSVDRSGSVSVDSLDRLRELCAEVDAIERQWYAAFDHNREVIERTDPPLPFADVTPLHPRPVA